MDAKHRDATISALTGLEKRLRIFVSEAGYDSKDQASLTPEEAGYRKALVDLLKRTLPDMSELHKLAKDKPLDAIRQARAYLEQAYIGVPETKHQETFDGFFVSLIFQSWWV